MGSHFYILPGPKNCQTGRWRSNTINHCQVCTLHLIWKWEHCYLNIFQSLCILQILTSTKSKKVIAMDWTVYIGRVDVIKIHFLPFPFQLVLWKAVGFSCLLQLRFIEFLNLSYILFVRYFDRLSSNGVHKSHISTMATLPHFLTLPCPIAASSDHALFLYPENFLPPFLNCTCPQVTAFCISPTVKLCTSFFTTELGLLFLQLLTSPKMFISNGLWPIVFGYPTFNEICPIPNLSPSPQSKNFFYFLSSNIYIHILITTTWNHFISTINVTFVISYHETI